MNDSDRNLLLGLLKLKKRLAEEDPADKANTPKLKQLQLATGKKQNYTSCNLGNHISKIDEITDLAASLFNIQLSRSVLITRALHAYYDLLVDILFPEDNNGTNRKQTVDNFMEQAGIERDALYSIAGKVRKPRTK